LISSQSFFSPKDKVMKKMTFIGIDVSSKTLDICVQVETVMTSSVIKNSTVDIRKFLKQYEKHDILIAMENTGRYNWNLYEVLADKTFPVYVISPLHLKKSMGLVRGKNDKVDAIRITAFLQKHYQELEPWTCPAPSIQKLKVLLTERNCRIKIKRQLLMMQSDYSKMKKLGLENTLKRYNLKLISEANNQIKELEKIINELIKSDPALKDQSSLIQTVPGVGKVLSWNLLAKTAGFTTIKDPRKMACYCGVVPFEYQSGSSVFRRPRVSMYADKSMKSLLHLAAMSAIRLNNDLRVYYLRKVKDGKNKMSILNAVRNKIIHRVFAVIKNQAPYQINLVSS
jgi:transposase